MAVGIVRANYLNTERKLRRLLRLVGYAPKKDTIVLKPNGASSYGHALLGDYTAAQLIEAFIRLHPDREIIIAEGAAVGMDFEQMVRALGYKRLARRYDNVRLANLEREERVELDWEFGKIRIPRLVLENEYVNCPKMKTHVRTTVTLGYKNQKGLLEEKMKKKFHWMDIHAAIRELGATVRPALTLVDGVMALEGNGPNSITGRPKVMNVLVAGQDMTEVDNACVRIMRIPHERIKHLPEVDVEVVGESIEKVSKKFVLPDRRGELNRFANAYYSLGCSGCLESLSGGLRGMASAKELPYLPRRAAALVNHTFIGRIYLFMGKNNEYPEAHGKMVCIGNCTKKFAKEHDIKFIPGCPPDAESLTKLLDE